MSALAALDIPAVLGILTGFGMVVILPTIALLLHHQRKMAELLHQRTSQSGASAEKLARLESEIGQLRALLMEHLMVLDDRSARQRLSGGKPTSSA